MSAFRFRETLDEYLKGNPEPNSVFSPE